ncbi:MAG TPA: ester cyclase [Chitinophagaceae bacterium]
MKKLAFALSAVILSCLVTCTNNAAHEDGTSEKAHKNLENLKAVINMFEMGDYSKAGDYIAADGVDHTGPTGEVKGLDNLKAMFAQMGSTMTDVKNEVVKGLADDDYSMVWIKQSWTQKTDDPMMKMKAGDKGNMESVEVCKHGADGKITDHWGFLSMADMMKMMPQMPKDTSGTK